MEEDFKKLPRVAISPIHKCLLWLAWDIGENIFTLLQLQKKEFVRGTNEETKEVEYKVFLDKKKLKRTRRERTEITNFKETADFLDIVLKDLKEEDLLFKFGHRQALKVIARAVKITKIKCRPKGENPSWKDLRSSMACYLLNKGWDNSEINSRLGHTPSSSYLDKYLDFASLDKHKPKKKLFENAMQKLKEESEEAKQIEKLQTSRIERLKEEVKDCITKEKAEKLMWKMIKQVREDTIKATLKEVEKRLVKI